MNEFNQNNVHGNNVMNFGPQKRELNAQLEAQLKELIPVSSPVNITSVLGDSEAYNFASQIKAYLENNGYGVDGVNQAVYSGPVDGQIIENPKSDNDSFKIIIGSNQSK